MVPSTVNRGNTSSRSYLAIFKLNNDHLNVFFFNILVQFKEALVDLFNVEHIQVRMIHIIESSIVLDLIRLDGIKLKSNKRLWQVRFK